MTMLSLLSLLLLLLLPPHSMDGAPMLQRVPERVAPGQNSVGRWSWEFPVWFYVCILKRMNRRMELFMGISPGRQGKRRRGIDSVETPEQALKFTHTQFEYEDKTG